MTKAFDSALRLLSRREHGAKELNDKLKRKGFSQEEIKHALDYCDELGLQSDERFAEHYIRYRISQGFGPLKMGHELKSKGIDSDLIKKVLDQEQDNWLTHALCVWEKKCKGQFDLSFNELQKQQRFLLYRGFDTDIIAQVIKAIRNCSSHPAEGA